MELNLDLIFLKCANQKNSNTFAAEQTAQRSQKHVGFDQKLQTTDGTILFMSKQNKIWNRDDRQPSEEKKIQNTQKVNKKAF